MMRGVRDEPVRIVPTSYQRLGKIYAIASDRLISEYVLENMESGFLNTSGTLGDKLMAALLGREVRTLVSR